MIFAYAGATAPDGFLLCYGQAVSRTDYARLFAVIGTTFGAGDGTTTFNVPDLRGRVAAGRDNMGGTAAGRLTNSGTGHPGIDGTALGAAGGEDRHQLTVAQTPAHSHGIQVSVTGGGGSAAAVVNGVGGQTESTNPVGGDEAHPNVQPTIVLNYIVKT